MNGVILGYVSYRVSCCGIEAGVNSSTRPVPPLIIEGCIAYCIVLYRATGLRGRTRGPNNSFLTTHCPKCHVYEKSRSTPYGNALSSILYHQGWWYDSCISYFSMGEIAFQVIRPILQQNVH